MQARTPPSTGLPLWPLALAAALLPLLAAHVAWWLSTREALIPACNPYWDGCVSISRAARHGLGNIIFKLVMLPCAVLQAACWLATAGWLRRLGAPAPSLAWLGLVAGLALALYAAFLGTDGKTYELLRRYGIYFYFGFTYLALLVALRALQRRDVRDAARRPLMGIALVFMGIGLGSLAVSYTVADKALRDRWENVLEWHVGLWLVAIFVVLAWRWWRGGERVGLV